MTKGILRSGAIVSAGQAMSLAISILRSLFIAKLVGSENWGLASAFLITVAAVEFISDIGLQKQVIQSPDADDPEFLNTAHTVMLIRGIFLGLILFVIAGPSARWFQAPDAVWAFQCLALMPILKSFANLDNLRVQRRMQFAPFVVVEVVSQIAAFIVGILAAYYTRSYSAVLLAILTQAATAAVVSQIYATQRYALGWEKRYVREMASYGWPLAISGALMFLGLQADSLIVGRFFGLVILGNYSLVVRLASTPTQAVTRVLMSVFFPILTGARSSPRFIEHYDKVTQMTSAASAAFGVVAILVLPWLINLVYGDEYPQAGAFVAVVALMMVVRLMRTAPAQAMLALAETRGLLVSNIVRAIGVPVAFLAGARGASVETVVFTMALSELFAQFTSIFWLKYLHQIPVKRVLGQQSLTFGLVGVIFLIDRFALESSHPAIRIGLATALALALTYYGVMALNGLRASARSEPVTKLVQPTG